MTSFHRPGTCRLTVAFSPFRLKSYLFLTPHDSRPIPLLGRYQDLLSHRVPCRVLLQNPVPARAVLQGESQEIPELEVAMFGEDVDLVVFLLIVSVGRHRAGLSRFRRGRSEALRIGVELLSEMFICSRLSGTSGRPLGICGKPVNFSQQSSLMYVRTENLRSSQTSASILALSFTRVGISFRMSS